MLRGLPVIGVIGSGTEEHASIAEPLGWRLAEEGFHLLTGGGLGVMAAVSRGFASVSGRRGLAIGIIPGQRVVSGDRSARYAPKAGYPNTWIDLPIYTHLPLSGDRGTDPMSRNHINVLTADFIVALPGGSGTRSEIALALDYGTPVVLHGAERPLDPTVSSALPFIPDLDGVMLAIRTYLAASLATSGSKHSAISKSSG